MTTNTMVDKHNIISNAFQRTTKAGKIVYRINIDNGKLLSYLEEGKTHICIDLCCNGSTPRIVAGTSKQGFKWSAMQYYVWAVEPQEKGATNGGVSLSNVSK